MFYKYIVCLAGHVSVLGLFGKVLVVTQLQKLEERLLLLFVKKAVLRADVSLTDEFRKTNRVQFDSLPLWRGVFTEVLCGRALRPQSNQDEA